LEDRVVATAMSRHTMRVTTTSTRTAEPKNSICIFVCVWSQLDKVLSSCPSTGTKTIS